MYVNLNKMLILKNLIPVMMLMVSVPVFSQSLDDDLKEMLNKMKASDGYSISCSVRSYSKKGGQLVQQIKASAISSKEASYSVMGEVEMLQTSELSIVADAEEKLIEIRPLPKVKQGEKQKGSKSSLNMEEFLKLSSGSGLTFKLFSTDGSIRTYTASNAKAGIKSVSLKFDSAKKVLTEYAIEQVDEEGNVIQYTVVDYTEFEFSVKDETVLSPKRFYTETDGKLKGIGKYSSYKIVKQ